jgi:hypothetical protein
MNENGTANRPTTAVVAYQPRNPMEVPDLEVKNYQDRVLAYAKNSPKDGALFPADLTPVQAAQLARVSLAYGLDPFMGELTIYKGKPYVTIDGRTRLALDHPMYDGMKCEPATPAQREAFRCGESEHLWYAEVWRKDKRHTFSAYGRSNFAGDTNFAVKTHPQEIARKRALHRALRDAFSIPLPGLEEADGYTETVGGLGVPPAVEDGLPVDYETGEIIDGEAREVNGIRPDQTVAIHAIPRALGWRDADYRGFLLDAHGVTSSKDLTEGQAAGLIESLGAIEDAAAGQRRLDEIKARLAARGMNLAELWGTEMPDINYAQQRAGTTPPAKPTEAVPQDQTSLFGEPSIADDRDPRWQAWLKLLWSIAEDPDLAGLEVPTLTLPCRVADLEEQLSTLKSQANALKPKRK